MLGTVQAKQPSPTKGEMYAAKRAAALHACMHVSVALSMQQ